MNAKPDCGAAAAEIARSQPSGARVGPSLWPFFAASYVAVLMNIGPDYFQAQAEGWAVQLFLVAAFGSYGLLYLVPAILLTQLTRWVLHPRLAGRVFGEASRAPGVLLAVAAIGWTSLTQVVLFADTFIYRLYAFHLNGFVWNLIVTPGGMESMGLDSSAHAGFALLVLGLAVVQTGLWLATVEWGRVRRFLSRGFTGRVRRAGLVGLAVLMLVQTGAYGLSTIRAYGPILAASDAVPLYVPVSMRKLGKALGLAVAREQAMKMPRGRATLHYPLHPLVRRDDRKPYNIVWLVAESLRADMLDATIMPRTAEFAAANQSFLRHYSGGNGTRNAIFSMFYGLHGPAWFWFLNARRGPVLMDVLMNDGYQMQMFTSACFTYPEFDRTVFAAVPSDRLHENDGRIGWKSDRRWSDELIRFLDSREPGRPFMTFMFYESPHASYNFPPECAIRKPYCETVNYALLDPARDAPLLKNRYINACHHLDTQWGKVLDALSRRGLLESTIVILTGDHGEEFMEKGRLGHNSAFSEEQLRVPLVLHVPGRPPARFARMTSHLDLPATVLSLLGVANPPADYCCGQDLLSPTYDRKYCVAGDWSHIALIDPEFKAILPVDGLRALTQYATADDRPLAGPPQPERLRREILQTLTEISAYGK